jgi:hypothetical protein
MMFKQEIKGTMQTVSSSQGLTEINRHSEF